MLGGTAQGGDGILNVGQLIVVGVGGAAEIAHGNIGISGKTLPAADDAVGGGRNEMVLVQETQHVLDSAEAQLGPGDLSLKRESRRGERRIHSLD